MKVTYIGHSGFSVEFERVVLLFDYYTGKLPKWPGDKLLLVFASHSHTDHFNWRILRLAEEYPRIHYFLGDDICPDAEWLAAKGIAPSVMEKAERLAGGREITYEDGPDSVRVRTLQSTDMGVAFLAEAEGKRIYHAGDLNWWHWIGEPDGENAAMGEAYRKEIDSMEGEHFDLAFVPLDPRQEECYFWGMNYFLKKTDSPVVFPMHLWGKYETIQAYKQAEGREYAERIMDVTGGGQEWNI